MYKAAEAPKHLLFVTACSEKSAIAVPVGTELAEIVPRLPALRLFTIARRAVVAS